MKVDTTILDNWKELNERITEFSEDDLKQLIEVERKGKSRTQFLLRLYGRYNTLRTERERRELLSEQP